MGDNQHRRIDFVDLTKGVCIILVVMAHIGGAFDQLDKHSMLSCFRVAPVPMAAMMGKEWGGMGQNYLRSLLALGFQAFLIIVCVAIYAVLVQNIALEDDIIMAIWSCVGYTVLLCFTLFKTGSLAKSVFQAH